MRLPTHISHALQTTEPHSHLSGHASTPSSHLIADPRALLERTRTPFGCKRSPGTLNGSQLIPRSSNISAERMRGHQGARTELRSRRSQPPPPSLWSGLMWTSCDEDTTKIVSWGKRRGEKSKSIHFQFIDRQTRSLGTRRSVNARESNAKPPNATGSVAQNKDCRTTLLSNYERHEISFRKAQHSGWDVASELQ